MSIPDGVPLVDVWILPIALHCCEHININAALHHAMRSCGIREQDCAMHMTRRIGNDKHRHGRLGAICPYVWHTVSHGIMLCNHSNHKLPIQHDDVSHLLMLLQR